MDELVDLMNEYAAIDDKDSLYARVLASFIAGHEARMRCESERKAEAASGERG